MVKRAIAFTKEEYIEVTSLSFPYLITKVNSLGDETGNRSRLTLKYAHIPGTPACFRLVTITWSVAILLPYYSCLRIDLIATKALRDYVVQGRHQCLTKIVVMPEHIEVRRFGTNRILSQSTRSHCKDLHTADSSSSYCFASRTKSHLMYVAPDLSLDHPTCRLDSN